MIISEQKITIIATREPKTKNVNDSLKWLGASLGLFNLRDRDLSCFRIFIVLLKNSKTEIGLSSDEIAYRSSLSRGTVIHHLNRLMKSGLVISKEHRYSLRVDNLKTLIEEVEHDVNDTIKKMKTVAKDIDEQLGL